MKNKIGIKSLFLLVFLSGSALVLIGTFFNYDVIVLILLLFFMLSYFISGNILVKNSQISKEQFADSNYYLGFLFTLVSLSSSLIWIVLEQSYLDDLIGNFGIALLTTVFGLFIRIYIINFVPNTNTNIDNFEVIMSDKLHLINSLISENANKNLIFARVLDAKINAFQEVTQKTLTSYSKNLNKSLTSSVDELEKTIKKINKKLSKDFQKQVDQVTTIAEEDKENKNIKNKEPL